MEFPSISPAPYFEIPSLDPVQNTFSMGMPRRLATVSMMRMLAWCSSSQSTWLASIPALSKASKSTSGTRRVANL